MEEWENRGMREWKNGGMREWRNKRMEEWENRGMREWKNGGMREWRNKRMEKWENGGMREWIDERTSWTLYSVGSMSFMISRPSSALPFPRHPIILVDSCVVYDSQTLLLPSPSLIIWYSSSCVAGDRTFQLSSRPPLSRDEPSLPVLLLHSSRHVLVLRHLPRDGRLAANHVHIARLWEIISIRRKNL